MKKRLKKQAKNIRSIRSDLFLINHGMLLLIFFLVSSIGLGFRYYATKANIQNSLFLVSAQKAVELNNSMDSVERSVNTMNQHILATLDEKKLLADKEYERLYFDELTNTLSQVAYMISPASTAYFRMERDRFGNKRGIFLTSTGKSSFIGKAGVLLTKQLRTKFISVRLTDLDKYSPSDMEHVGWYYIPIWNKKPTWLPPYENKNINIHMISYVEPMYRDDELLGVVGMDINMATIKNIVDTIPSDTMTGLLLGAENNLVYCTDYQISAQSAETSNDLRALRPFISNKATPDMFLFNWNGTKHYGMSRPLTNGMNLIITIPQSELVKRITEIIMPLAFVLLFTIAVAELSLRHARKKIIRPITELTNASYRLSRGEIYIPITYSSDNEIGLLADSIKKMAVQLGEYIGYIREQAESEREAKEIALNASKAKSDFLANMSHEIRTPINAVLGMDEMILRESTDDNIRQYAINIKQAGNSLLGIVNDVLDFSKIESGKMELIPEAYDLASLLSDSISMISERAKQKGLIFALHINPEMPETLIGDSVRIKQCILNLLTNAVKYTPQGTVTFSLDFTQAKKKDGVKGIMMYIGVSDTGIGIKKEDMEKLFSPFERIEENRNRTIEGTGLGINIVQKTLALMDSTLEVRSEYGKGSDFSFKIWQGVMSEEPLGDVMEKYHKMMTATTAYTEKLFAPKARLLFVDDTAMNLDVVRGLLKNTKIQVDTALSGKETLLKVQKNVYDILFIDHRMPGMDGIETLVAMKMLTDNKSAGKPCIALTANAISGAREFYLKAGFTDYLTKPVNPEKLEQLIRIYLPPELIETPETVEKPPHPSPSAPPNFSIEGIDIDAGITNCGDEELLRDMFGLFYESIPEESKSLEDFLQKQDLENFRIKVHSLKSTSRLIGALELSKKAAELEKASAEKNLAEVQKKTPDLLDFYNSYREKLAAFAKKTETDSTSQEQKPKILPQELEFQLTTLHTFAKAFDIDGVTGVMEKLSAYTMPEDFAQNFAQIQNAIQNVDFNELIALLRQQSG